MQSRQYTLRSGHALYRISAVRKKIVILGVSDPLILYIHFNKLQTTYEGAHQIHKPQFILPHPPKYLPIYPPPSFLLAFPDLFFLLNISDHP